MKKIIFTTGALTVSLYISVDVVHTVSASLSAGSYDPDFNVQN